MVVKKVSGYIKSFDLFLQEIRNFFKFIGFDKFIGNFLYKSAVIFGKIFYPIFFHLKIEGVENVPLKGALITVMNHRSWLDVLFLGCASPRKVYYIVMESVFKIPILGLWMDMVGSFPIKKTGTEGIKNVLKFLKRGEIIHIFPEGTAVPREKMVRAQKDTGLLKGASGAVRMAIKSKVPILPIGISGSAKVLPPEAVPMFKKLPIPKFSPVTLCFGKPLYFDEYYDKHISHSLSDELTHQMMKEISKLIIRR